MSLLEIRKKGTRLFSSFCYFYWRWSIKICRRGFILLTPNQESLEKKDKTFFQFILTTYRQWTINSSPQRLKNVIGLHLLDSPMTKMSHQNQSSEYIITTSKKLAHEYSWFQWLTNHAVSLCKGGHTRRILDKIAHTKPLLIGKGGSLWSRSSSTCSTTDTMSIKPPKPRLILSLLMDTLHGESWRRKKPGWSKFCQ